MAIALVIFVSGVAAGASLLQAPKRPAATPAPTPSGLSVTALKTPPAGQRLVWFRDDTTALPFVIRATDWSGRTVGQLSIACAACGVLPSPDGQRLLIGDQSAPGPAWKPAPNPDRVYTSSGKRLAAVDGYQAEWADEHGGGLCTVRVRATDPVNRSAELILTDPATGHSRTVATVTTAQAPSLTGSWTLVSCNTLADRALLVFTHNAVRALRVVELSTGHAVIASDVPAGAACGCPVLGMAVSGDGTVASESLIDGTVRKLDMRTGAESPATAVWTGKGPVESLSWTGREAVTPIGIYSFPAGDTVWLAPLPSYMLPVASRPGSDDLLLSVWGSSQTNSQAVIVRADGSAQRLAGIGLAQVPPLPF